MFGLSINVRHLGDWSALTHEFNGVCVNGLYSHPVNHGELSLEVIGIHSPHSTALSGFLSSFRTGGNVLKVLHVNRVSRNYAEVIYLAPIGGVLKYIITSNDGILAESRVMGGFKWFRAYFLDEKDAEGVCSDLKRRGSVELIKCEPIKVARRREPLFRGGNALGVLTESEVKVLKVAYRLGYFSEVKTANLSDVARALGVGKATANHHIRSAVRKIVKAYLNDSP